MIYNNISKLIFLISALNLGQGALAQPDNEQWPYEPSAACEKLLNADSREEFQLRKEMLVQEHIKEKCFNVNSWQVTPLAKNLYKSAPEILTGVEVALTVEEMIAIGKKIWTIVEAGKPVLNVQNAKPISVIPNIDGSTAPLLLMDNWSSPESYSYQITFLNGFNMKVVDMVFTVMFQHSGDYNGVGKYLTSLIIIADYVDVSWGFDVDVKSVLKNITNVGSKEEPVAGALIDLQYTVESPIKTNYNVESFFVDGSGMFKKVSIK